MDDDIFDFEHGLIDEDGEWTWSPNFSDDNFDEDESDDFNDNLKRDIEFGLYD